MKILKITNVIKRIFILLIRSRRTIVSVKHKHMIVALQISSKKVRFCIVYKKNKSNYKTDFRFRNSKNTICKPNVTINSSNKTQM